jgi:drug/metabolite transporter (DMT)-like permease
VMPSWDAWMYALALGAICTALAYIIFYRLFAAIGPTKSMTVAYLIPLFGVLWGVVFLRERVSVQMIIGGAGILLGMALVTNLLKLQKKSA